MSGVSYISGSSVNTDVCTYTSLFLLKTSSDGVLEAPVPGSVSLSARSDKPSVLVPLRQKKSPYAHVQ